MLGRLASLIAKQLLNGEHVVRLNPSPIPANTPSVKAIASSNLGITPPFKPLPFTLPQATQLLQPSSMSALAAYA